jgi:hypothetical protein
LDLQIASVPPAVPACPGSSVETLVSTYVGALAGDQELANERIDAALVSSAQTGLSR